MAPFFPRSIQVKGAEFLNDMAIAENRHVYVTETGADPASSAVFRVGTHGEPHQAGRGASLKRPYGIDPGADGNLAEAIYAMPISREGEILGRRTLGQRQLDCLVVTNDDTVLVSSWTGHHVARLGREPETRVTGLTQPACFDFSRRPGAAEGPGDRAERGEGRCARGGGVIRGTHRLGRSPVRALNR